LLQREKFNGAAHFEWHAAAHEGALRDCNQNPFPLAIPFPLSIPPNETAIKEKEFGSKKIFLFH